MSENSKTMRLWLYIFAIGFSAVALSAAASIAFGVTVPFVGEFLALLGVGGGSGTARNVFTDGYMHNRTPYPPTDYSNPSVFPPNS
jgi:hypothetical protein